MHALRQRGGRAPEQPLRVQFLYPMIHPIAQEHVTPAELEDCPLDLDRFRALSRLTRTSDTRRSSACATTRIRATSCENPESNQAVVSTAVPAARQVWSMASWTICTT